MCSVYFAEKTEQVATIYSLYGYVIQFVNKHSVAQNFNLQTPAWVNCIPIKIYTYDFRIELKKKIKLKRIIRVDSLQY